MGQSLPDVRIEKTLDFFGKVWYTETYAPGRWAYAQKRLGYSQGVRQRTLTPSFRAFESRQPSQRQVAAFETRTSLGGVRFALRPHVCWACFAARTPSGASTRKPSRVRVSMPVYGVVRAVIDGKRWPYPNPLLAKNFRRICGQDFRDAPNFYKKQGSNG